MVSKERSSVRRGWSAAYLSRMRRNHVAEVGVDAGDFVLHAGNELVGLVLVELQDARHLDFHQAEQVVARNGAHQLRVERHEPHVDVRAGSAERGGLLELAVLVDALFYEQAL